MITLYLSNMHTSYKLFSTLPSMVCVRPSTSQFSTLPIVVSATTAGRRATPPLVAKMYKMEYCKVVHTAVNLTHVKIFAMRKAKLHVCCVSKVVMSHGNARNTGTTLSEISTV